MKCIRLKLYSPFHLGRGLPNDYGSSNTMLHSDTLKAALFSMAVKLDKRWEHKADEFHNAFSLSSAYPFYENIYFFPRPLNLGKIGINGKSEMEARKLQKGIKYLDKSLFERILNGEAFPVIEESQIMDKEFALDSPNPSLSIQPVYSADVQQRVKVGSNFPGDEEEIQSTRPYFTDRVYFNENAGLYVLVDLKSPDDQSFKDFLLACFRLLGEEGIGTDRSSGNGLFGLLDSDMKEFGLKIPDSSSYRMALGLFCPSNKDMAAIDWNKSFWHVLKRGGYMGGSSVPKYYRIKKNAINMIGEGSILCTHENLIGKKVNLKPEWDDDMMHDVWREGRTLTIPIIVN